MLKIWKNDSKNTNLEEKENFVVNSWIELTEPTIKEIDTVVEKTGVDRDLIVKMLDDEELPRVEVSDNATLVAIDTPYLKAKNNKHEYKTYPLGIIIAKSNYIITVSPKKNRVLSGFKKNKIKDFRTAKKTRFLIQIFLETAFFYLKDLSEVNDDIRRKEKVLKKSTENKDLIDLLDIEKTLVYFITSLKANEKVLEKISKRTIITLYDSDLDLLEDAMIENQQAIEMSGIYKDILSSVESTYETIVSNNLNIIMKFLAGITIVMSIPTIISSFLGMNVPLGSLGTGEYSFMLIVIYSCLVSLLVAWLLKIKNML